MPDFRVWKEDSAESAGRVYENRTALAALLHEFSLLEEAGEFVLSDLPEDAEIQEEWLVRGPERMERFAVTLIGAVTIGIDRMSCCPNCGESVSEHEGNCSACSLKPSAPPSPGPEYLDMLDSAWRAVDALGGTGVSPPAAAALDAVIDRIEGLGGMDPGHRKAMRAEASAEAA